MRWRRFLQDLGNNADIDTKSRAARDIYLKRHTPLEGLQGLIGSYRVASGASLFRPGQLN